MLRQWGSKDVTDTPAQRRERDARLLAREMCPTTPAWITLDEARTEEELTRGSARLWGTDAEGRVWSAWNDPLWSLADQQPPEDPPAQVRCSCGSRAFRITYGEYSCLATCVDCGRSGEVYSG